MSLGFAGDATTFERVEALMRETAEIELLPRFGRLRPDEVREKQPGDIVTVADEAAESRIARGLAALFPGTPVVGEEAVAADATVLHHLRNRSYAWIVDPLDGTANFAAGREAYAIIVCLVHEARPVGGWILHPQSGSMAIAQAGAGVMLDGQAVRFDPAEVAERPSGFVGWGFLRRLRSMPQGAQAIATFGELGSRSCAGVEYLELMRKRRQFLLYRWTKPWDHAAGALMVSEAGGVARRFDGGNYHADQASDAGILTASDRQLWQTVIDRLLAPMHQPQTG